MTLISLNKPVAAPEQKTAQDFINVVDVRGRILYSKDKNIFTYALIKSNDLTLMTKKEQKSLIEDVCRALMTEKKPFKLILMPRSVDISGMLDKLVQLRNGTSNPIRLQLIRKEMNFIGSFTESDSDIRENGCYLVMWEPQRSGGEKELLKRMDIALVELQKYNVITKPLEKEDIAFMCSLFAKPQYIHDFSEDDLKPSITTLEDSHEKN